MFIRNLLQKGDLKVDLSYLFTNSQKMLKYTDGALNYFGSNSPSIKNIYIRTVH